MIPMLKRYVFLLSIAAGLTVWPSCSGGSAAVTELPNPVDDDRPAGSAAELPRLQVDLPPAAVGAPTRVLSAGDDLQRAIDDAQPGDIIALQPGVVFKGAITLPKKDK